MDVTGTPQLELTIGTTARQADYASGSGTNTPAFRYIVQGAGSSGDGANGEDADTTDGISIGAFAPTLNNGTINDARDATDAASLALCANAISPSANHKVNGVDLRQPSVSGVTVVSAPPAGGSYGTSDEIRVRVTFHRAVGVTGSPQ